MEKNIQNDITSFIKSQDGPVKAKTIFDNLKKLGYPQATVSGNLRRLFASGQIVQPRYGYYANTNSKNVLNDLKNELSNTLNKYDTINHTIISAMSDSDENEYTEILNTIKKITSKRS